MKHLKEFHAKIINDSMPKELLICSKTDNKEHVDAYSQYDSKSKKNFNILLKNNKITLTINYFDLEIIEKDSRQVFASLRQSSPYCEARLVLDFDKEHDNNKKIHLNIRHFSEKNEMTNSEKLEELNHLPISYYNDGKFTLINHFETLLDIIKKLGENKYLSNFQKYEIQQLDTNSPEYSKLNTVLKKYITNEK